MTLRLPTNRCLFLQGNDITVRDTVVHDCPRHGILGADQDTGDVTLEHVEVYDTGSGTQYHQVYMSADQDAFPAPSSACASPTYTARTGATA